MVSSANSSHKAFMNKGESFLEREKRSGPNTEPCGTPYFTGRKSDLIVFRQTNCPRFDRKMKKLSAVCSWIIHKELISAKVDYDP